MKIPSLNQALTWVSPSLMRCAACGLIALGLVGCGSKDAVPGDAEVPRKPRSILLITVDTTRADHLGSYGNDRIKTPNVDRLAAEGALFTHAYSSVPVTTPSHSTILTGKYPIAHGVRDNGLFILGNNQVTLAEALRERGWRTGASIGAFPLIAKFGLDQGFELYDDNINEAVESVLGDRVLPKSRMYFDERRAGRVNDALFPWIDKHAREPFFAWAHYYDPHQPFEPPAPYDQLYAGRPYEGEIAYADESFGQLLERLRTLGIDDRTIVVLTADHGEGLGEHRELTHSVQIYNTTLHVPLIIRVPGAPAGTVVDEPVGTVDIMPTLLDLLGVDPPEGMQGRSLVESIHGRKQPEPTPPPLYAESLAPRLGFGWGELRALIKDDHKYIYGPRPELYDIGGDPSELVDLVEAQADLADTMQRQLARFLRENASDDLAGAVELDDETRRKLEALGYISSGGAADAEIVEELRPGGVPPQDRVEDINDLSMAKQLLFAQNALPAQELILSLLERQPGNPTYLEMLATAYLQQGQIAAAAETVEQLSALETPSAMAGKLRLQVGSVYFQRGEHETAEHHLNRSLTLEPSAEGHYLLANIHANRGDLQRKQAALEAALEVDSTFPAARIDLAVLFARAGDRSRAETEFQRAIVDRPYFAKTFYNYGVFLLVGGDREGALVNMKRTVELEPAYWPAYLALVELHLTNGEPDEARRNYELLRDGAPQSPHAAQARQLIEEAA